MTPEELQHLLDGLERVQAEAASAQNLDEKVAGQIRVAQEQLKNAYAQALKKEGEPPAPPPPAPAIPESVPAVPKVAVPAPPALDGNDLWGKILTELKLLPKSAHVRRKSAGVDRDIWQDLDEADKP